MAGAVSSLIVICLRAYAWQGYPLRDIPAALRLFLCRFQGGAERRDDASGRKPASSRLCYRLFSPAVMLT